MRNKVKKKNLIYYNFLQEQLYGAHEGDLKSSPCLERNYEELVNLLALHFAVIVGSIKIYLISFFNNKIEEVHTLS